MNAKDKLNIANSAFFNLETSFSNSRLVFIGISSMYARWLTAYKASVVNKFYKIYNELKSVKTPNDVLMFAKRNTLVFMNVFSQLLDTENHKMKFKDFVANNIKPVNEGRKSNSKIQTNSLLDFVDSICNIIFNDNKKTELLRGFKQEYSEFYQLSELTYFKRSVMELKNKTISSVKSDFRKYGHLATLYNNADKANDENGL